jgi:protein-S-isoprenylcysteine O-methyltransferase Ste14
MTLREKWVNTIFKIATGNYKKRLLLTPVAGFLFLSLTSLFVIIPVYFEHKLGIPVIIVIPINYFLSLPLLGVGTILVLWTNFIFLKIKGSPVPLNPPPQLVTQGPFAYSRNPMTTGLFLIMFGLGFYYGSLLSVLIFTPLYIFIHTKELRSIEEPELERRLGTEYIEYKSRVPMFFPRKLIK